MTSTFARKGQITLT